MNRTVLVAPALLAALAGCSDGGGEVAGPAAAIDPDCEAQRDSIAASIGKGPDSPEVDAEVLSCSDFTLRGITGSGDASESPTPIPEVTVDEVEPTPTVARGRSQGYPQTVLDTYRKTALNRAGCRLLDFDLSEAGSVTFGNRTVTVSFRSPVSATIGFAEDFDPGDYPNSGPTTSNGAIRTSDVAALAVDGSCAVEVSGTVGTAVLVDIINTAVPNPTLYP